MNIQRGNTERRSNKRLSAIGGVLSLVAALAMYQYASKQAYKNLLDEVQSEAGIVFSMTSGFVRVYSRFEAKYAKGLLPSPAAFRAEALHTFTQDVRGGKPMITGAVGLPGREIAQVADDELMRRQLAELEASPSSIVMSSVFKESGLTMHRSLWAFKASEQACADCHNEIQNRTGSDKWKVGDLMGAQIVEQNIDSRLALNTRAAIKESFLVFVFAWASWLCCVYLLRQLRVARELKKQASTDALTGCINRREMQRRFSKLHGDVNGAVLMLDLDKFKSINDTFGHDVGDEVIRDFSQRVKERLRTNDWMARFGGEEFLVWLPDVRAIDAILIAERLRESAETARINVSAGVVTYTVSIGMHLVQSARPNLFQAWIKAADKMLYRSKMEGRNRVSCNDVAVA